MFCEAKLILVQWLFLINVAQNLLIHRLLMDFYLHNLFPRLSFLGTHRRAARRSHQQACQPVSGTQSRYSRGQRQGPWSCASGRYLSGTKVWRCGSEWGNRHVEVLDIFIYIYIYVCVWSSTSLITGSGLLLSYLRKRSCNSFFSHSHKSSRLACAPHVTFSSNAFTSTLPYRLCKAGLRSVQANWSPWPRACDRLEHPALHYWAVCCAKLSLQTGLYCNRSQFPSVCSL